MTLQKVPEFRGFSGERMRRCILHAALQQIRSAAPRQTAAAQTERAAARVIRAESKGHAAHWEADLLNTRARRLSTGLRARGVATLPYRLAPVIRTRKPIHEPVANYDNRATTTISAYPASLRSDRSACRPC